MADSTYQYFGQTLSRAIFAELIAELYAGQVVENGELTKRVADHHQKRGGKPPAGDLNRLAIKALRQLRDEDRAANLRKGVNEIFSAERAPAPKTKTKRQTSSLTPQEVIGEGKGEVYAYYFPAYKQLAEARGEDRFPVKVGKAIDQTAASRVNSDVSRTAVPERPVLALVMRTDSPSKLETYLHMGLEARGLQLHDITGNEWFLSSPEEVRRLYDRMFEAP